MGYGHQICDKSWVMYIYYAQISLIFVFLLDCMGVQPAVKWTGYDKFNIFSYYYIFNIVRVK